jgi:hypothetical protein
LWSVTVYSDNPAGRLHQLLTAFRTNAGGHPSAVAWAGTVGLPDSSNASELTRRLTQVLQLPQEIESELAAVDERDYDRDHVMRWRGNVERGLGSLFSDRPSNQVAGDFDDVSLNSLESCNWVLHRYRPQRPVAESDLDRIRELINELEAELRDSSGIDPELREFLLFHCAAMSRALRDFTIRGPVALEDALYQAWGAGNLRVDLSVRTETASHAWEKFKEILTTTALVLGILTTVVGLPEAARLALEGPPPVRVDIVQPTRLPVPPAPASEHPNGSQEMSGNEPGAGR